MRRHVRLRLPNTRTTSLSVTWFSAPQTRPPTPPPQPNTYSAQFFIRTRENCQAVSHASSRVPTDISAVHTAIRAPRALLPVVCLVVLRLSQMIHRCPYICVYACVMRCCGSVQYKLLYFLDALAFKRTNYKQNPPPERRDCRTPAREQRRLCEAGFSIDNGKRLSDFYIGYI